MNPLNALITKTTPSGPRRARSTFKGGGGSAASGWGLSPGRTKKSRAHTAIAGIMAIHMPRRPTTATRPTTAKGPTANPNSPPNANADIRAPLLFPSAAPPDIAAPGG